MPHRAPHARKLLELRTLEIQVEGFERGPRDERHHTVRQRLGLAVVIRSNVGLPHEINVTALELSVEDGEIGNVFEDQLLDVRAFTEILSVGDELEMIAGDPLAPLERPGADWTAPD